MTKESPTNYIGSRNFIKLIYKTNILVLCYFWLRRPCVRICPFESVGNVDAHLFLRFLSCSILLTGCTFDWWCCFRVAILKEDFFWIILRIVSVFSFVLWSFCGYILHYVKPLVRKLELALFELFMDHVMWLSVSQLVLSWRLINVRLERVVRKSCPVSSILD